jgi:hypothetical protein
VERFVQIPQTGIGAPIAGIYAVSRRFSDKNTHTFVTAIRTTLTMEFILFPVTCITELIGAIPTEYIPQSSKRAAYLNTNYDCFIIRKHVLMPSAEDNNQEVNDAT